MAAKLNVSPHPGRQVSSYVEAICRTLNRIADIQGPGNRTAEIKALIDAMRIGFANGDLYTNVPIGKTDEDVAVEIAKIFADYKAYRDQYPERLQAIRDLEQKGAASGQGHLIKWMLYLDNPERRKLLDEAIAQNPGVNLTSGNRDLNGTPWSEFAALDPSSSIFRIPGSTPANPSDLPPLPGYSSPSLAGLNETERLTRIDPRFTGVLPAFPAPSPNEQRLGQLPPTTATPSDPLVLKSDPMTGAPLPFYENSLTGDPSSDGSSLVQDLLPWLAGGAALGVAAPFVPAWLLLLGAGVAAGTSVARAQDIKSGAAGDAATGGGGVFSTGAPAYNNFVDGHIADNTTNASGYAASSTLGPPLRGLAPLDQEAARGTIFADRFGSWTDMLTGTIPAQDVPEAPVAPTAGVVAPPELRRLIRVNALNVGNVFASGSAPIPYLPSTEFNGRFGNWATPTAVGRQPEPSRPIGPFANEPSYLIPPPIFGVDGPGNPHNAAEEWFSRWIRPLLPPE